MNHAFIATSAKEDAVYLVSYADYPEDALKQHTPDQILDAARSGTLVNLKGKLVSDQKIMLDKTHPGREFLIEVPGAADYRARIFFANRRLYQVVFVTSVKELASRRGDADTSTLSASRASDPNGPNQSRRLRVSRMSAHRGVAQPG